MKFSANEIFSRLFGFNSSTYYRWKENLDKRPIISLLQKYFTEQDLQEFLETGEISKLEILNKFTTNELKDIHQNKKKIKTFLEIDILEKKVNQLKKEIGR